MERVSLKNGDKLWVRDDLDDHAGEWPFVVDPMLVYVGKFVTFNYVQNGDVIRIYEDQGHWAWTYWMFEQVGVEME